MGTRSHIAIENPDGTVDAVYCHWDGYETGAGATLLEHYLHKPKVQDLISLGSMSILGPELGKKHPWNPSEWDNAPKKLQGKHTELYEEYKKRYGDMCVFYHRDRGDKLEHCAAFKFPSVKDFLKSENWTGRLIGGEEYKYLLRRTGPGHNDYEWYYADMHHKKPSFRKLTRKKCGLTELVKTCTAVGASR